MSFFEYMHMGFSQGIVIGVPDFAKNNQYTDMKNIGHDIRVAMKKVTNVKKRDKTNTRKTRSRSKTD